MSFVLFRDDEAGEEYQLNSVHPISFYLHGLIEGPRLRPFSFAQAK